MPTSPAPAARPNVVVILVDDMGYSDIGCYGSEIETPNLDRLAGEGVRFSQMYNTARCCPARASLLTGLHPHQAGVGHMVNDRGIPAYQGFLNDRCLTLAEVLREGGYRTLMSGKWHIGGQYQADEPENWDPGGPGHPIPTQRGFDRFYGTLHGAGSYFNPYTLMEQDRFVAPEGEDYYYTDVISRRAADMVGEAAAEATPFFLYLAYTAPHWPLHALPEDIARFAGRYEEGWDVGRERRLARMREMGLIDADWPLSPRDGTAPAWADAEHKEWEAMRMAVYAAQVHAMDRGVGTVVERLEALGILDHTLIVFLSDNGGCAEGLGPDGWTPRQPTTTRDGRPVRFGNAPSIVPGPADTFMSYDLPWANMSNTPFRLYKHWTHEGGIATPLILRGPGVPRSGGIVHAPAFLPDIMATCCDATGVARPDTAAGGPIPAADGVSLLPATRGEPLARKGPLCFEHEGNRAVREGRWKLVCRYPGDWELYDMDTDRTELNDLAAQCPEVTARLAAVWDAWAERCGVRPWDEMGARK